MWWYISIWCLLFSASLFLGEKCRPDKIWGSLSWPELWHETLLKTRQPWCWWCWFSSFSTNPGCVFHKTTERWVNKYTGWFWGGDSAFNSVKNSSRAFCSSCPLCLPVLTYSLYIAFCPVIIMRNVNEELLMGTVTPKSRVGAPAGYPKTTPRRVVWFASLLS